MIKVLKILGIVILIILILISIFLGYVYITEYKPEDIENLKVQNNNNNLLEIGKEYNVMTYNIGYCGLDKDQDFFMDGGKKIMPERKEIVENNLNGIKKQINDENLDFVLLQEVDRNSKRTYYIDEMDYLIKNENKNSTYSTFYRSNYVPYPFNENIGKVEAGQLTISNFKIDSSKRLNLPSAYKFPVRAFQCKRALQKNEFSILNSDKKLVVYNVHLEAYDKNNTRQKQLEILAKEIEKDYQEGNYVIVGGDFNQRFEEADNSKYPILNEEYFVAPIIKKDMISENFKFVFSDKYPTSRLLNEKFTGDFKNTQLYVIDGFIFSKNIEVLNVDVKNYNFEHSDHNPVVVNFKLK